MQLDNKVLIEQVEELAKILNQWSDQVIIGGGVALVLYDTLLSKAHSGAVGTTDIDFLIPRKPIKTADEKISKILRDHGYAVKLKSMGNPSVESYIKTMDDVEIEVEFLTDAKAREKQNVVSIHEAGVTAQALSFIEMSLNEGMALTLPNSHQISVVRPEAWVFHKGLTFVKRTSEIKKYKDLYGIWFVLSQLNDTSFAVQNNLPQLINKNIPSWKKTFTDNLLSWISNATPKDWQLLESQDIEGRLGKSEFVALIKSITNI